MQMMQYSAGRLIKSLRTSPVPGEKANISVKNEKAREKSVDAPMRLPTHARVSGRSRRTSVWSLRAEPSVSAGHARMNIPRTALSAESLTRSAGLSYGECPPLVRNPCSGWYPFNPEVGARDHPESAGGNLDPDKSLPYCLNPPPPPLRLLLTALVGLECGTVE